MKKTHTNVRSFKQTCFVLIELLVLIELRSREIVACLRQYVLYSGINLLHNTISLINGHLCVVRLVFGHVHVSSQLSRDIRSCRSRCQILAAG